MSKTNGRIDYSRLVSDIDFAGAFEGTRFEQYTDTESEGGVGSVIGGWVGAAVGRFVGMALGQVAQELVIDELFGSTDAADEDVDEDDADASEESAADDEQPAESEESTDDEQPAEADAE